MSTLVLKFGGSSVATIEKIQAVASRVAKISQHHHRCVVVVSAMGDDTDILLEQAASLNPQKHLREYDMLLATGEQKSMALTAMALQEQGIKSRSLTGWQARIHTTAQYSHARIVDIDTRAIEQCWQNNEVPVIAGFQGVCDHEITTLGRGGSDLTAVALAAALKADECQIFTDVDGVYSADPRIVPNAVKWDEITYAAMLQLASVGAQVLHNRAVELACKMHVKLRVLSSFIEGEGTMVTQTINKVPTISGIAHLTSQVVFVLAYRSDSMQHLALLDILNRHKALLSTVHTSRYQQLHLLSFAVSAEKTKKIEEALKEYLGENLESIESHFAQTQISIIGLGVQSSDHVFSQVHDYLIKNNVHVRLMTSSEVCLSFYVDENVSKKIAQDLHELFHLQIS